MVLERKAGNSGLVIADSGDADRTPVIFKKIQGGGYGKLEVLTGTGKQHGSNLIVLYQYAISQGADYIFQTDLDGLTSPAEFAAFGSRRLQHDAILGDRKVRGDGEIGASDEHIVCALLKLYFTVSAPEANAPFRLMKSSVVKKYIDRLSQDYNLANNMLTTYFACYKEKPIFRKVSFKVRQGAAGKTNYCRKGGDWK